MMVVDLWLQIMAIWWKSEDEKVGKLEESGEGGNLQEARETSRHSVWSHTV